jgi:hypothetical protein
MSVELYSDAGDALLSTAGKADKEAAAKVAHDYNFMPSLFIEIMPLQTRSGCTGTIDAKLSAYIEAADAHMIPTQVPVFNPKVEIWAVMFGFVGSQQTYSNQAINLTEQIMKKLVNDWAASQ